MSQRRAFWRRAVGAALALLVVSGALLAGAGPAYADEGAPRLEYAYRQLKRAAEMQADHLDFAGDVADRAQEWIDARKEKGLDVSALQAALDAYRAGLATAQGQHDQAAAVLAEHKGFDGDGKVSERTAALATIRDAGRALRDARWTLREATVDLHRAIADWRREHRPQPASS